MMACYDDDDNSDDYGSYGDCDDDDDDGDDDENDVAYHAPRSRDLSEGTAGRCSLYLLELLLLLKCCVIVDVIIL